MKFVTLLLIPALMSAQAGNPLVQADKTTGIVQIGAQAIPSGAPHGTVVSVCAYTPNGELNVKCYGGAIGNGTADDTAAIQGTINAAGSGGAVFIPVGTYKTTASLNPLRASVVNCASADQGAFSGSIIAPSGAIWGFEDIVHDGTRVAIQMHNCAFALTSSSLGGLNLRAISSSKFYNISVGLPSTGSVIGVQFDAQDNAGNPSISAYWNDFYSPLIYNNSMAANSHVGFSWVNLAVDEHIYGGHVIGADTSFAVTSGSKAFVSGTGAENFGAACINIAGANATDNTFQGTRCESHASGAVAINIGSGAVRNHILWPSLSATTEIVNVTTATANTICVDEVNSQFCQFDVPLQAPGYKSSDGSTGVTGSTCTSFKNGLCVAP